MLYKRRIWVGIKKPCERKKQFSLVLEESQTTQHWLNVDTKSMKPKTAK